MVYVEWFDYEKSEWCLSKMNIFKAMICIMFDKYLGCNIVPKRKIQFY